MTQEKRQRLFNYFHELTDGKVLLMEDDYRFIENAFDESPTPPPIEAVIDIYPVYPIVKSKVDWTEHIDKLRAAFLAGASYPKEEKDKYISELKESIKELTIGMAKGYQEKDKEIEALQKTYVDSSEEIGRMGKEIERLKGLIHKAAERFAKDGMMMWTQRIKGERLSNDEDFKIINKLLADKWQQFKSENNL